MLFLAGIIAGAEIVTCQRVRQHKKDYAVIMKNDSIIKMFNQWLIIKQEGKSVDAYFKENNYKKIAIYGMGYAGRRLLDDLKGTGIEVVYTVDRKMNNVSAETEQRLCRNRTYFKRGNSLEAASGYNCCNCNYVFF